MKKQFLFNKLITACNKRLYFSNISLILLVFASFYTSLLSAQIVSRSTPSNDCNNPEFIEPSDDYQLVEIDLNNLSDYYLSFNTDSNPNIHFEIFPDSSGNLPSAVNLYLEDCFASPIEQATIQTDSNGVNSLEILAGNLQHNKLYILEVIQNQQNQLGLISTSFSNYSLPDPTFPPLDECREFMYNGSFEIENIPQQWISLDERIHYSDGYLLNDITQNRADYYHSLGHPNSSPPNTALGNNIAPINTPSGSNAYSGLFSVNTEVFGSIGEFREWIVGQLARPMEAGEQYKISYYVHLSNNSGTNDPSIPPGIRFSSNPTNSNTQVDIVQMTADIQPQNILSNTSNWHKIESIYTANGNEHYVTIANFLSNSQSYTGTGRHVSYFFIDAISIEPLKFGCCTSFEIPDGWDVNDLTSSSIFSPYINNNTLADIDVNVKGTFTINSNFSIDNVHFIMDEDAQIEVSNATFDINNSEFYTCEDVMWEGINVNGVTAEVIVDGSTIADANKAVNSLNGGVFTITNSVFDANYYGLYVDSYYDAHQGTVTQSTFKSSYFLKDNSLPNRPDAGIYLNNVIDTNLLSFSINSNLFTGPTSGSSNPPTSASSGLQHGIIVNSSYVNIYNNEFESFIKNSALDPQNKVGIKIIGFPYPEYYFFKAPTVNIQNNTFNNTTAAISSSDIVNLQITNNTIAFPNNQYPNYQTDFSILIKNNYWPALYIDVQNNDISGVVNGIMLSNCYEQDYVLVNGNDISLANTKDNTGIYINDVQVNSNMQQVHSNTIDRATHGIMVNDGFQPSIVGNDVEVNNNFFPSSTAYYGISTYNSHPSQVEPLIKGNTVSTSATTSNTKIYGISIASTSMRPEISCNLIQRTGTAMYFSNVINYSPGAFIVFGNEMEYNHNSFVLKNNSELGDIGHLNKPSDNKWVSSANYDTYANGANGNLTTLYTRGGGLPYEPISNGNAPLSTPVSINASAAGDFHDCGGGGDVGPSMMTAQYTASSLPNFDSRYSSDSTKWIAKYHYYRSLAVDSLISDRAVQAFKDSINLSPLGTLLQLNTSNHSNTNRLSQVNALICNTVQESRLKTVVAYQLQAKSLNWDTLPDVAFRSLENIALECPFEAGPAVYEARSLLMQYTAKTYFNPCEGYTSPTMRSNRTKTLDEKDSEEANESISIYPNPMKDELNINIQLEKDEVAEWTLQNIEGQLIQSGSLKNNKNLIDLSHLRHGVYFIQLKVNNQLKKTDKLIVQ